MKVAAVLATRDRKETCLRCLERLLGQSAPLFKIVVVDNASSDGTGKAIAERHGGAPALLLIESRENLGNPEGIAVAMQTALAEGADAAWILDDDSWPREDALENLLAVAGAPGWIAGSLVLEPASGNPSWPYGIPGTGPMRMAATLAELPAGASFETRGMWLGALIPRQVIEEVGLPDGRLFLRGEDEDYPARLRKAGYRFLCIRGSVLEHPSPRGLQQIRLFGRHFFYEPSLPLWKAYYMVRNQAYVRMRYGRSRLSGAMVAMGGVALAMAMAAAADDRKAARIATYARAGWHGMTGRLGKTMLPPG